LMGGTSVLTNMGSMKIKKGVLIEGGSNSVVNSGTLTVVAKSGAATISGPQIANSGTVVLASGTFDVGPFDQSAGSTQLVGGSLTVSQPLSITGGTFSGHGALSGGLDNSGDVSPDDTGGVLSDTGSYDQTGTGTVSVTIDGVTAGNGYSQLAVSGSATLGGTLAITTTSGFVPSAGQSFVILTTGNGVSGTFANVTGTQIGGLVYKVKYSASSVTLTVS
jgi:hypothetical protein